MKQKNWAAVRTIVGGLRYDVPCRAVVAQTIWVRQSQLTNYLTRKQHLLSKRRDGAKEIKKVRHSDHPRSQCLAQERVCAGTEQLLAPPTASTPPPSTDSGTVHRADHARHDEETHLRGRVPPRGHNSYGTYESEVADPDAGPRVPQSPEPRPANVHRSAAGQSGAPPTMTRPSRSGHGISSPPPGRSR